MAATLLAYTEIPTTCNLLVGTAVPMPTLPLFDMRILSLAPVNHANRSAVELIDWLLLIFKSLVWSPSSAVVLIVPATCSFCAGVGVPMPTLPPLSIVKRFALLVKRFNVCADTVPNCAPATVLTEDLSVSAPVFKSMLVFSGPTTSNN